MGTGSRTRAAIPRDRFDFELVPESEKSFENALEKAKSGTRLTVADGVELLTTGTDIEGIDLERKEAVRRVADRRRAEMVGDEVTFVANLNNNLTTACHTGCLFCNFRDAPCEFEVDHGGPRRGFTKSPDESHAIVTDAVDRGISEVTSVSGLHPSLALDEEHRELLDPDTPAHRYTPPEVYETDPGTYAAQLSAMSVEGVHVHAITPEEASHAKRETDWSYEAVYRRLAAAGLDSVPGTAAEILVDEVREVICPDKLDTDTWLDAMDGAAAAGLPMTATIMYGHVENERHRIEHLQRIRDLQDRTGAITEFVPLSFMPDVTPLVEQGLVDGGPSTAEDELMIAVSRLFLDNVDHIQSSWVKFGDRLGVRMLEGGADDFSGTLLSESITKRAGGSHGQSRSVAELVEAITSIDRVPVERSTTYDRRRRIDPDTDAVGPILGSKADGSPMIPTESSSSTRHEPD